MKILRIEIAAFGKWRQKSFDFYSGNQLIYGGNEAGKSTIYQFIQAILFGFPSKGRKKKDYTPKDGSAYGGKIWLIHPVYGDFAVERCKQQNRGKSKVWLGNQVGSDELLEKLIAPLTKELFQQVFTFQQEQLMELDHLREKELHDALISLGITGSSQVFQKRQEYYQKAQQLFKKKGQKLLINQKLNEWKELQEKIHLKQEQEAYFGKLIQQEQEYESQQQQLLEQLHEANKQFALARQQELNFSLYEEWQSLKKNIATGLPDEQLLLDLESFSKRYQQTNERLEELEATLEKHSGMDQQSARYYFYLEQEQELKDLQQLQFTTEQLSEEWQRLQIETRETNSELKILEQRWQWQKNPLPEEFLYEEEWKNLLAEERRIADLESQISVRLQIAKEQQKMIEAEVNELEETYPALLQNQSEIAPTPSSKPYMLIAGGAISIAGIFVPMPLKVVFLLIGAGMVGYFFYKQQPKVKPKNDFSEIKGMWQEKLGQLDLALAQLAEAEEKQKRIEEEKQILQQEVYRFADHRHLGKMDTLKLMKEYGQEVIDYQKLYGVFVRKHKREQEIQEKLQQIDQKFEFVKEWLPIQDKTISEKMAMLSRFIQEMEQMKFARSYQQNTLLKQEINQLKKKQKVWIQEYSEQLSQAGLSYPSEVPVFLQKAKQAEQQMKRYNELSEMLRPLFPEELTKEKLSVRLRQLKEKQGQLQQEEKEASENRQRLQLQVEELQRDGTLDELYQQASRQKAKLQELLEEWGAFEIAGTFLGDLSTEMSERQLPQLLKAAGDYLGILTKGNYQKILLKNDTLTLTDGYTDFPIYELSTGTKDQLIMAMRFAYLSLEANRSICPIIIDDGWLHYDHQRKYQLAELLAKFGEKYQIICFSSDKEMVSYYHEMNQTVKQLEGANNEKNS
ncbi:ATP-binding protein [Enterococcus faecium]|uniref:ATP-binding protein n=1 Tax=Enterococcus faecium TaxID=1352 RepID=UPI002DB8B4FA|nr:AAA family ATPase [Enterococcus faecium]MEB6014030.1 AAA family ATPase [Enterococcus faecium]